MIKRTFRLVKVQVMSVRADRHIDGAWPDHCEIEWSAIEKCYTSRDSRMLYCISIKDGAYIHRVMLVMDQI